jgi:hypothetical protein
MTQSAHTPGPWNHKQRDDHFVIRTEDLQRIAITQYVGPTAEEANARLIAAAPEMLEALRIIAIEAGSRKENGMSGIASIAYAAIARAQGGPQ